MEGANQGAFMSQQDHLNAPPSLPLASEALPVIPQPPTLPKNEDQAVHTEALHTEPFTAEMPPAPPQVQDTNAELQAVRAEVAKLKEEVAMMGAELMNLKKIFTLPLPPMPMGDASAMHQAYMQQHHAAEGPAGLPHNMDAYHASYAEMMGKRNDGVSAPIMAMAPSEQANGLHALHAAAEGLYMAPQPSQDGAVRPVDKPPVTKRARVESLQLEMDEQEVIQELRARGLIIDNPPESDDVRKGGRPPLGMGALKRVKDMYDKRQISMEAWRSYYQEKCRESGFDAKPHHHLKRQKFLANPGSGGELGPRHSISYSFPAYDPSMPLNESEVRLVRTLCGELTYPPDTDPSEKFTWVKTMSDEHNFEALRLYLLDHRPSKNRRGKKPTGIENFPMVFDLWAASFIESSQFRRICKYSNIHIEQYHEDAPEEQNDDGDEDDIGSGQFSGHESVMHALPMPPARPLGNHENRQLDIMASAPTIETPAPLPAAPQGPQ